MKQSKTLILENGEQGKKGTGERGKQGEQGTNRNLKENRGIGEVENKGNRVTRETR